MKDDIINYSKMHEFALAIEHGKALDKEDYKACQAIQQEVDKRIENGTINKALMNGFRNYNKDTGRFEDQAKFSGLNGLFDKFKFDDDRD